MKSISRLSKGHYMNGGVVFLLVVALIAGMAACNGGGPPPVVPIAPTLVSDWFGLDGIRNDLSGNYRLLNDLDSTTAGYEELASETANGDKGWEPIGALGGTFKGTFDGQGKTISGLVINRPGEDYVGLFGLVQTGTIKNVGLENVDVVGGKHVGALVGRNQGGSVISDVHESLRYSTTSSGTVVGKQNVGGLVGANVADTGSFSAGEVRRCLSSVKVFRAVDGSSEYFGGLVGLNSGNVVDCIYNGEVLGMNYVGGLVGKNDLIGEVVDCGGNYTVWSSSGTHVGGVAGHNVGNIKWTQYKGLVNGLYEDDIYLSLRALNEGGTGGADSSDTAPPGSYVGGVVGLNEGTVEDCSAEATVIGTYNVGGLAGANTNEGTLDKCSSDGDVTGISYVGGLVGGNAGTVDSCSSIGSVTGQSAVGRLVGYNADTGAVKDSHSDSCVTGAIDCGPQVGEDSGSAAPAVFRLTIYSTTGGSVTAPGEGIFSYDAGAVVFLAAEAEEGYRFVNWTARASEEGYLAGSFGDAHAATTTFAMPDEDVTVTANFVSPLTHLFYGTVSVAGERAREGTLVQAFVDSMKTAETTVDAGGRYALLVPGTPGAIVTFRVDGLLANESGTWQSGKIDDDFDLTVD